ncbi:hypothetical protein J31TS4_46500 [Paenibacillus sp. J31TS4]|nr:hypothetical protein J31TS4_46500 [Paenibacillus sp. J31TS4]
MRLLVPVTSLSYSLCLGSGVYHSQTKTKKPLEEDSSRGLAMQSPTIAPLSSRLRG